MCAGPEQTWRCCTEMGLEYEASLNNLGPAHPGGSGQVAQLQLSLPAISLPLREEKLQDRRQRVITVLIFSLAAWLERWADERQRKHVCENIRYPFKSFRAYPCTTIQLIWDVYFTVLLREMKYFTILAVLFPTVLKRSALNVPSNHTCVSSVDLHAVQIWLM